MFLHSLISLIICNGCAQLDKMNIQSGLSLIQMISSNIVCITEKTYDENKFSNVSMNLYEHCCLITFTVYKNNKPFQYLNFPLVYEIPDLWAVNVRL